jgi:hypothetical protein
MEITQEYNVDCASQRMVIVMGEIGICLKGEVGQFSSLLPRIVHSPEESRGPPILTSGKLSFQLHF